MLLSVPESNMAPRQRHWGGETMHTPAAVAAGAGGAGGAPQTPGRSNSCTLSTISSAMMMEHLSPQLHNVRLSASGRRRHHSMGPSSSDIAGAIDAPILFTPTINSPRRRGTTTKRRSLCTPSSSFPAFVGSGDCTSSSISTCSLSSMSSASTASSSCWSNSSPLTSKLAKLQQQSLILHHQQQQQRQQLQQLKQQPKRRVTFAEDVYLYPSPHTSNDHVKPLWYSADELADFKKERRHIVKQLKKAQFDITRVPRKYCLRGYEAYFSLNINRAMKVARELSLCVVAVEQARQRARGIYNPELLRQECSQASQWARDNGAALGAQDAQLDFVEQDAHALSPSSCCHSSKSTTTTTQRMSELVADAQQPPILTDYSSPAANPAADSSSSSSSSSSLSKHHHQQQHRKRPKQMMMLTLVDDETLRQMEKTLKAVREMLPSTTHVV